MQTSEVLRLSGIVPVRRGMVLGRRRTSTVGKLRKSRVQCFEEVNHA